MKYTTRIIIGIALFAIIIVIGVYMYLNKEGVFAKYDTLYYPDGCKETFKNGVATSKLCTRGRILNQEELNGITFSTNKT
jgi:hypothetical protein